MTTTTDPTVAAASPGVEHGTYAAYQAERRTGRGVCPACRDAATAYQLRYRRRRELIDPLSDLLTRRPDLLALTQAGARFSAGLRESA